MIVDTHTHLWQSLDQLGPQLSAQVREASRDGWDQMDAGPIAHDAAMQPVDVAFVLGFQSVHLGAEVPTQLIASYVAERPERRIGFAGIDPMNGGFLEELDSAIESRLAGVVVSPSEQAYHPAHSRAMKLYELCQARGMPVIVHQGEPMARDSMMEYAQPFLLDEVARSFPQLRLLICNAGYPWADQALTLVHKHRNVYTELSGVAGRPWQLYNVLTTAYQLEVMDRLLLGSNFPHLTPQQAIGSLYSLNQLTQGTALPNVPREKVRAIVERDALECLGLRRGGAGASPSPAAAEVRRKSAAMVPTKENSAT